MGFLNPFKTYDVEDFSHVYVPLANAPRSKSVVAENARRRASVISADEKKAEADEKGVDLNGDSDPGVLTVEALRQEIDMDIAAGGHDTAYDRKSKVINKAIQDIGMGSYQWKLFVLCGFGWLADKYIASVGLLYIS